MQPKFEILYLEEAMAFIKSLPIKAQLKVIYNITKSQHVIDRELFKKLDGSDIWEFRTLYNGCCYRLFAFWDNRKEALVVATHGITKKTQKTPHGQIEKAEELRKKYFNDK